MINLKDENDCVNTFLALSVCEAKEGKINKEVNRDIFSSLCMKVTFCTFSAFKTGIISQIKSHLI